MVLGPTFFTRLREPHARQRRSNNPYFRLNAMATETFVLPGETLDPACLPSHPKLPLKLGPGLRHIPPNTITPTVAGQLCTDKRKNAVWVEFNGSRVCSLFLLQTQLIYIVYPHRRRPRNSHNPEILRRPLLRQSERLHPQCLPTPTLLRKRNQKDKTATLIRLFSLRARHTGEQAHGPRA